MNGSYESLYINKIENINMHLKDIIKREEMKRNAKIF